MNTNLKSIFSTVALVFLLAVVTTSPASANVTGALLPTANGSFNSWLGSSTSSKFTLVDETTCNGLVDYVYATSTNSKQSFRLNLSAIPVGATITGITTSPCAARISGAGSTTMDVFYRFNASTSASFATYAISGTTTPKELASSTITGLNLKVASSTTFEIGVISGLAGAGVRLSQIITSITYTP